MSSFAYAIGHITVIDAALWDEYRCKVPATLEGTGGTLMFRARTARVLGGQHAHEQTVVICFPDLAALNGWFDSPAYQVLIPLRERAARVDLIGFEA